MPKALRVLSAGAAQGLIESLSELIHEEIDATVQVTYGPVGVTRDAVYSGTPCDVVILSRAITAQLVESGHLVRETEAALGEVHTALCTREGTATAKISTPDELAEGLLTADEVCIADPDRATAGIHFTRVLHQLAIYEQVRDRLSVHPNGSAVARAVASSTAPHVLGCAQITEIIATAGADLVGPLPGELELATTYTATVGTGAQHPDLARSFIALLTGPAAAAARRDAGFDAERGGTRTS
jgi:molybdate transport system substrate-binding protein